MGMKDEVFEKVCEVIHTCIGTPVENLTLETDLANDLGADSLDAAEVVVELEKFYKVQLIDVQIATVEDLVNYLSERI